MAKKKKDANLSPRIVNRRAHHDYHIEEKLEVGVVLRGSEVKSVRLGRVSLGEGYVAVNPRNMELQLLNVDIALYPQAGINQHEPKRQRRLLAHKRQIQSLLGRTTAKGVTMIPLAMYFVRGKVKVEIGVGTGKKSHDKREDLKRKTADREMRRAMTRKVI